MIYLDNNATTRVLPEVLETMLPFYNELWANPASLHRFGSQVAPHLDKGREQVAALIQAQRASEIIFTSGGTESNNLAIRGVLQATPAKRHIVTTQVEHSSVLMLCQQLEKEGYEVTTLPVDKNGELKTADVEAACKENTALVTLMWANNETGVIFPIEAISKICATKNILSHVDATQAVGKTVIDLRKTPVDLLSISGHKFHAPKGIGALYLKRGTKLAAQMIGGSHERGRRAGTQNVAGIVGLGKAAELARQRLEQNIFTSVQTLRNRLEEKLLIQFKEMQINGRAAARLPNTSSLSFEGIEGETVCLLLSEEGIAASTGAACSAGSLEPSHVLKAMGVLPKKARGTVRISLSFETQAQEIEQTATALTKIILHLSRSS